MQLRDRTVLVTGATGGIGRAIARRLHDAGAGLILTGRRADVLEPLADELGARSVAVDLAERAEVERLAIDCAEVDCLVANAGLPASGDLRSFSVDEIDRALAVNLRAPMVLARLLSNAMVARGAGHLVFVSSLAGKVATSGSSVYSATKFGLRGFGQGLRADLHGTGVGVSVVFPGFIRDAGMFHESGARLPGYVGTSTPEDVADGVVAAIEHDRGEVDVAPVGLRVGTRFAGVAPELSARINRKLGADRLSEQLAQGQADKR
jgi:uncharacterized protein